MRVVPFLCGVEASFVDAAADEGCEPGCDFIDLALELLRIEVDVPDLFVFDQAVESMRKPLEQLHALVVDDTVRLLIPQKRDAVFACVGRVVAEIQLMHEAAIEEMIRRSVGVCFVETPSWLAFWVWSDGRDWKEGLEMLNVTDEVGAMGEWAEETCASISLAQI